MTDLIARLRDEQVPAVPVRSYLPLQAYNWAALGMKAYDRNHFGVAQYYNADQVDREIERHRDMIRDLCIDHRDNCSCRFCVEVFRK